MKKRLSLLVIMMFLIVILGYYSNYMIKFNKINVQEDEIISQSLENIRKEVLNNSEGTTYYIAVGGESQDGTSPDNPMSLEMALTKKYYGNDKILFKSGDVFYSVVNFDIETNNDSYVYIGSYGNSYEKPVISGLNIISNSDAWRVDENGIYKIDLSILENFYGIGNIGSDPYNIGFFMDGNGNIYGKRKSSKQALKNDFEFYCENNWLYVKSSENPSEKIGKIGFAPRNNLLRLSSNTIVENLNIQCTGAHGIVNEDFNIKNVYIRNCTIENVGGSVIKMAQFARYGNAIQFWDNCDNVSVTQCIMRNAYDSGFTIQGNDVKNGFKNVYVSNNIFIANNYSIELFCRNNSLGPEQIVDGYKNCTFNNNIFINQGKSWSWDVRPDKKVAPEIVIWNLLENRTDIAILNNKYLNSRRIYYFQNYDNYKEEYLKSVSIDNNSFWVNDETSYLIDDSYVNYFTKDILKKYNIDQNSEFRLLSEKELSKINNEEILKSDKYDEIKSYYDNIEKEIKCFELENELINKYKELEDSTSNQKFLEKISELKNIVQNKVNAGQILTQSEVKELFDLHYDTINALNTADSEKFINIVKKLNEFEETYNKLFNLCNANIKYDKYLLRNKIDGAKKLIDENDELKTNLSKELMLMIDKYYEDVDSSINSLVCNKLVDAFYNYAYSNMKNGGVYIKYSEINITNKDVTATLESNITIEPLTSQMYVFTKNGSYTFKYKVNGEEHQLSANVDWIDKEAPVITGWENRVDELEAVVINVIDDNLDKIVVTKDLQQIDFHNGDILFSPGNYQIVATDKAGNSSTITLRIVDYIESNKTYYVSNNGVGTGISEESPMNLDVASRTRFYAGDKILFKAGETYKLALDWNMMGSPSNKVIISNYGQGSMPIIEGYISVVSNTKISNLHFMNTRESAIVTNQDYCENVIIDNCIFEDIGDTGVYLNRQVNNVEIKDCIFRDCTNSIAMKNDIQNLMISNIDIKDNIFISGKNAILVSGRKDNETYEDVEICNNVFLNQTSDDASIASFGFIEDTKFDVNIYNNVYYNFGRAYKVNQDYLEDFKNNLRSDNNTFYSIRTSKFIDNYTEFEKLRNTYNIDKNSKNILMDTDIYQVESVTEMANDSLDKDEILKYMNQTISNANQQNNVDVPAQSNNSGQDGVDGLRTTKVVTLADLEKKNSQKEVDQTISKDKIPYTGWKNVAIATIAILLIMVAFSGINYGKYVKDTKKQIKK